MIDIVAKLKRSIRKQTSSIKIPRQHDDNMICLIARIVSGPDEFLDHDIYIEIGVEEFIDSIPSQVLANLNGWLAIKGY